MTTRQLEEIYRAQIEVLSGKLKGGHITYTQFLIAKNEVDVITVKIGLALLGVKFTPEILRRLLGSVRQ